MEIINSVTSLAARASWALALSVAGLSVMPAWSQANYPQRPVRMVVPFAPGGASDFVGRILQLKMSDELGQQLVIDNRAGAATIIGLDLLAKSPPHGYTSGITTSTLAVNSTLNKLLRARPRWRARRATIQYAPCCRQRAHPTCR